MKSLLREVLITVVLAVAIFIGARETIQTYEVFQTSMLPNFVPGERVVVLKAVYWFNGPKRGDVIIFHAPNGVPENWIKRIIGLPGDTVQIVSGHVYVNGVKLVQPAISSAPLPIPCLKLPSRRMNFSSLAITAMSATTPLAWLMPRKNLIGKAWLISWPPSYCGIVHGFNLNTQLASANTTS